MSEDKKKSVMDNVIMGAIIGTAIGSALGMGFAPKKGKDTREILKDKGLEAGNLAKETGTGLFKVAKKLFQRMLKKSKKTSTEDMKAIPNEMETLPQSGSKGSANINHE
ncbi:MAG: YtxH domain-containing protein [Patescibacteria group bacterium]